ncbi:hypothetical protein FHS29_005390 [Saccharothrix tamanrassetensis]|uniref:DUF7674 domain-containing protein n=1 Tax=Saccharothrix tamanrassetensis TaxID=1051531 RepID=A0A841CMF4_9PSEU|nr:hypothetical protein [Saccharothrix tamanrassetensis]MBB5958781.1 hypothetical protein [Saccharothrix tamanrassetensis]
MGDWRTRASALLPELSAVVERESWSCHVFLSELWQLAAEAHRAGDDDVLRRVYGFAHWCFRQPEQFLSNASVVSFYEHVFDEWELRDEVAPWLPPEVVAKVRPLWEWRWPAERLSEVDRLLATAPPPDRNAV